MCRFCAIDALNEHILDTHCAPTDELNHQESTNYTEVEVESFRNDEH